MVLPVAAAAAPAAIPWLGGALAGGGVLLGSIAGGMFGNSQAKKEMDFQKWMSNTSHRREMADLEKAGLNPLLSGKYGGASTPGGAIAPVVNTLGNAMESGISNFSALQSAQQTAANIDKTKADTAYTVATTPSPDVGKSKDLPPALVDVLGPKLAQKVSNETSSAGDAVANAGSNFMSKASDIVDSIGASSASALDRLSKSATTPLFKSAAHNLSQYLSGKTSSPWASSAGSIISSPQHYSNNQAIQAVFDNGQ